MIAWCNPQEYSKHRNFCKALKLHEIKSSVNTSHTLIPGRVIDTCHCIECDCGCNRSLTGLYNWQTWGVYNRGLLTVKKLQHTTIFKSAWQISISMKNCGFLFQILKKSLISPLSSKKESTTLRLFFETFSSYPLKSTSTNPCFMVSIFIVAVIIK